MSRLADFKIAHKVLAIIAAILAIAFCATLVVFWQLIVIGSATSATTRTDAMISALDHAVNGVIDQESRLRGYLLSGEDATLKSYGQERAEVDLSLDRILSLAEKEPDRKARLAALRESIDHWRKDVAEPAIALMARGETRDQARGLASGAAANGSSEAIRRLAMEIRDAAEAQRAARLAAQDSAIGGAVTAIIVGGLVAFLAAAGLTWALHRGVSRPVVSMTDAMHRLAQGDKTVSIPAVGRKDEIGAMAAAVKVFRENALENDRLEAEHRAAEGERQRVADEARRAEERRRADEAAREADSRSKRRGEMLALADVFETSVKNLVDAVAGSANDIRGAADSLATTAEETSRRSGAVATASGQTSSNVQTVAMAAEGLSASIGEIGRQVAQSAEMARKAVSETSETHGTVKGLNEAAQKIGEVVGLINEIASQTNLLALNATIEAARAGEAGKGFSVVASEVKALANQTAKATDEIATQIAAMQQATGAVAVAIGRIGATIEDMNGIASTIGSAIDQQEVATREIADNVRQAAAGTQHVSANIAAVTEAAEGTHLATGRMQTAAAELNHHATDLRVEVDRFLGTVRAA